MIHDMQEYVSFFNGVRKRTMKYVEVVPDSILEWRQVENKFTTGDLLRHIGSAQRMFLTIFGNGKWSYLGHDVSKGNPRKEIGEDGGTHSRKRSRES